MSDAITEVGPGGLGQQFPTFADLVAVKAIEEGIEVDPLTPKLSLLARRLGQTMLDDSHREVYKPAGWSHASYRICITLWVMGPLPSHRVTAMTNMSRATVSAALKRSVDDGLVTKEASTDDARSVTVELTPLGEAKIRQSYTEHLAFEREWFNALTDIEKQLLVLLIEKLLAKHD
ncbi:hypothetical protein GCM10011490_27250 [Pseudoclavibacter endophyticus]|uniref:Winged helix-turn-helix transcriptional regulator n=1 Tax=Pseudoclavibacter endophyticus TaxID=1778590 RepID=A0A6H9WJF6_9MICO|nr:MarR family winged helix-turn-helix transcriptional regulator [Pseudoclavibacter endophyticus]KAB1646846.1 winged helix-turn-helix transcriptional regulator [Pseudoclavibacter endophyticus]GGA75064.1 hypothetical protein GCM10011490_27250 [Pseudoclavibacter endophyticus]